ncbi:MAG TPA: DUF488 domain-containing protein [Verrucomicrobia bacterium]|nr:MAG: hypothetical protein A2X46_17145 [Lentisphaerae bacterium GWF2_57_35]HBA86157.1 DUF488 domain-containing protein [Verrucomicrobiota bacterium]
MACCLGNCIYTIGHSNHSFAEFVRLLEVQGIDVIADVRSAPFSRIFPHFNREPLRAALRQADIKYVFMGDALGGRPADPSCFEAGQVQFDRVVLRPFFLDGLNRVIHGAEAYRIALMCSEKDPISCHRMLMVSRQLSKRGVDVQHILADGTLEAQAEAERRMMAVTGVPQEDLFLSHEALLEKAYALQSGACAFTIGDKKAE